ncbi:MAG: hypothetical protein AAGJ93_17940, partial [Bacteroidota bacterium]
MSPEQPKPAFDPTQLANLVSSRGSTKPPPPPPDSDQDGKKTNPRPGPAPDQYFETQRIFALLIAIDQYDMPGANLGGCFRDSQQVEHYLREQTENAEERLHLMTLRSALEGDTTAEQALDSLKVA